LVVREIPSWSPKTESIVDVTTIPILKIRTYGMCRLPGKARGRQANNYTDATLEVWILKAAVISRCCWISSDAIGFVYSFSGVEASPIWLDMNKLAKGTTSPVELHLPVATYPLSPRNPQHLFVLRT
jgi:hypothetical protein